MNSWTRCALTAALALVAAPAAAEWKEATSRHFVVYSELPRKELEQYVSRLEQFDGVVREIQGTKDPEPRAANRLTVFMVKSVADVERMAIVYFTNTNRSGIRFLRKGTHSVCSLETLLPR